MEVNVSKGKDGENQKSARTKAARNGLKNQQNLANIAEARFRETNLFADILSSFDAHGGSAENKLDKQFRPWLIKFALALYKNKIRSQAWDELKFRCDALMLLKDLYLFTYIGKTSADVLQSACRFLQEELDRLVPGCRTLHEKTSILFNHPKLRLLTVMSEGLSQIFADQIHSLAVVEQKLELLRELGRQKGSYKPDSRTFYLYGMATTVHAGTGKYHYRELARLTEAARIAHGEKEKDVGVDVDALKRRAERYIKRMSSSM
jgi:hypothetical protein